MPPPNYWVSIFPMGAERFVGLIENRKYRRASVLWPATLRCGVDSFDCVIFNLSANGAKVMIKGPLDDKGRVTLSSARFGALDGSIVWRSPNAIGICFLLAPELVVEALGDKLPLLSSRRPDRR